MNFDGSCTRFWLLLHRHAKGPASLYVEISHHNIKRAQLLDDEGLSSDQRQGSTVTRFSFAVGDLYMSWVNISNVKMHGLKFPSGTNQIVKVPK